jgi:hypothetical protein
MADLAPTSARLALLRAVDAGDVCENRDGAAARHVYDGHKRISSARVHALEEAGLIRLHGGRPSNTARFSPNPRLKTRRDTPPSSGRTN